MGTKTIVVGLVALLVGLSGCAQNGASGNTGSSAIQGDSARTSESAFAFGTGSVRAESRVSRAVAANGNEVLHGTTEVRLEGEPHPLVIEETAEIDASGKLLLATAELRSGRRGQDLVRSVRIDAQSGVVTTNDRHGESLLAVAVDQPWVYEGLFGDVSPVMGSATAVQAWVAKRAADAGSKVRAVDVGARRSFVTLADQVVIDDAPRKLVILGDEVIEVDSDFVRSLPWKALEEAAAAERQSAFECVPGPV